MIEDETGKLYRFALNQGEVKDLESFGKAGDYEGIALHDSIILVLESNGTLHRFEIDLPEQAEQIKLPLPKGADAEGLCWDPYLQKWLVACKEPTQKGKLGKTLRQIYQFSLAKQEGLELAYTLNLVQLEGFARLHKAEVGETFDAKRKRSFMPSGIAIHPHTLDRYILSATGNLLLVMDTSQVLKALKPLDKKLFPQAEGICFLPNGDLYLSSEGDGGKGTLHFLPYIQAKQSPSDSSFTDN